MNKLIGLWKYLLTMVLLLSVFSTGALAFDVSGNVTSTHAKRVYLSIKSQNGSFGTSITNAPGGFTIQGVPAGNYVVTAFEDVMDTGSRHVSDPSGTSSPFTVSANTSGITVALSTPTISTVPAPNGLAVLPSDGSALVMWYSSNMGQGEQVDKYGLFWSTSSDVVNTYTSQGGSLVNIPATGEMRGLILTDLTTVSSGTPIANGATLYFAVTAKIGIIESAPVTLATPVTIGPASGAYSVSGTVTFTGSTLGKPLLLAVVDNNQNGPPSQIYMTKVLSPVSPQSYTVTGVPNGTYRVYAFFDLNGNSLMDAGDLDVSDAAAPVVTVTNGPAANADITLNSALESMASVRTNHWKDSSNESYGLNFEIDGMYKRPVKVTLMSGPNVTVPLDIALDDYGRFYSWTGIGSAIPQPVNDSYVFNVTYSDLSVGTVTASVTGVLSSFATPVAPVGAAVFNSIPTFSWLAPATPPSSYGYRVSLNQQNGGIYWDPKEMSSATTSVNFNFDGSASQGTLTDNTAYSWQISVFDALGNSASQQTTFTYGTPAGTPISITTTGFTSPSVNAFFSQTLFATGGSGSYTWSVVTGTLPAGLTLSPSGVLSGTPTTVGVSNFTVLATDTANPANSGSMSYNFNVINAGTSLNFLTTSLPNAAVNSVYGQTISVTGGTAPYTFSLLSGTLPTGMTLNSSNGFIDGTPTVPGTYTFTVQVQDQILATANASLTLTVTGGSSDISGAVSYSGSKTGRVYITVNSNNGMMFGTSISGPGPYTIRGVPSGNYTVNAFMDALNLGTQVLSAPAGSVSVSNPGSAANITLSDPVASAPGQPTSVGASPGDGSVLIGWDSARNANGVETADSYTVYWNTTAAVSKSNYVATPRVVPAGADSPAIIDGLVNGSSYYFVVVPTSSGIEGTASAVFGPVVAGATTGNNTVSGTVNYSGPAATGPLYVAVVKPETKGAGGVYFTKITSPTTSQSFSVSGIPNGTYEIYAIYDMNNDKLFAYGDVTSADESGLSVTLTGSGSMGNTITLVSSNANVNISTNHYKNSDLTNESYSVNGNVRSQLKRPVAAVLSGVPASSGLTVPMDLGLDRSEIRFWGNVTSRPSVGESYTFDVTYSDGSTETISSQVSAVLDSFPNNPAISEATVSTVPTFTWTAPTTPPASYNYSLWVGGSGGNFWEAWSLPSSQLSAVYGFDGKASALSISTQYSWNISVRDQKGNQASINSSFTPTVVGVTPETPNMSWGGVYHLTKPDGTQLDVIDLGTNVIASTLGTLSATVTGPNGFSYTFTDADIYPYMNGQLAVNKQYSTTTAPLSAGVYTFTLDDGQGHVSKRIDTHGNILSLPIVDSTTIQRQRKSDGSYVISWAPVNDTITYNYRVRVQTVSGTPVYLGSRSMTGSETIPAGTLADGTSYQIRVEVSDAPSMDLMFNRSNSAFVDFTPAVADYDANRLVFSYANAYNRFEADGTQQQSFGFGFGNSADALKVTTAVVTGPNGFSYTFQAADLLQPNGVDFTKYAVFSPVPAPGLYTFHVTANGLDHVAYATLTPTVSYPLPDVSTYQVEDLNNGSIRFSWADVNYNGALYYRIFVSDTVTGQYFTSGRLNQAYVDMTTSTFGDLTTKKWRVEVYDSSSGITIRNRVNGPYTTAPLTVPVYDATSPVIGGFGIVTDQKSNGTIRANIWFGATDSDGTITELRVEGPNGYVRDLLTQGYKDGTMYRLFEAGSPQVGLYKFTAVDNSGKTSVRYNYQTAAYSLPNVDFKTFTVTSEPNGDVRISWAAVASNIPVWYILGASTNTDADVNGQPDALSGTNISTFLTQSSVVLPASFMAQPNLLFRVSVVDGSNFTTYNNRSLSAMIAYQGVGFNYAALTDTDGDGYASNVDANDNDATIYPFAPVASDTTPPTIVSTTPATNATNVSINTVLTVKFSEAIDQSTLPDETAFLKTSTGTYIPGIGSYDTATNTGTFTPSAPLSFNTTYTGTLSGVKDVAGNTMTSSFTFIFTTAAAPDVDSTPPVTAVSVVGGVYDTAQTVALSANEAATTYYTTDGTVPTVASPVYSAPLTITDTTTLKFFSKDIAGNSESPKTVIYKIDSTAPVTTASPAGGTYASSQSVTLSVSEAATTYYTTNGSVPTTASLVYSRPIVIGATATLKFFSKDAGGNTEPVKEVLYTIDTAAPVVTVLPAGGSYTSAQSVILTANESATIYYTLDGTIPTTASTLYSGPIAVNSSTTVIYFAMDAAGNSGLVQTADYFIDVTAPSLVTAVPANNAANVSISSPITLTFSEPVTGMPDLTAVLKNNSTGLYIAGMGTESSDKKIYTFIPNTQLESDTSYSIQLTTVTDYAGNALPATTLTFTTKTATATDTTPPLSSASVIAGVYSSVQSVSLRANENAKIYYTTDGTTPTASSNLYSAPISISSTTTLKFFAVDTVGNAEPDVNSNLYIMVPSGDVTRDDKVDIADAYRLLQIVVGRIDATATDKKYGDVGPLVNGIPTPDETIGIGDVVVLLRRIVGSVTW